MRAKLLDGKALAERKAGSLKKEIESLRSLYNCSPKLVAVQIGRDRVSSVYIKSQERAAASVGLAYETIFIDKPLAEDKVISTIEGLNSGEKVTGIIIQRPLPSKLDIGRVYSSISAIKDAEGMHPENMGKLFFKGYAIAPPTALAVMELIGLSRIKLYGKEVVIIGHSEIVGKPLSIMLLNEFATVSVCHIATSESDNLIAHIKRAEVLIVAVGKANLVKGRWIKKGSVVIDVGVNKLGDRIVGDVEFDKARLRASYITPVPGGVGPLTTVMLMRNCVNLFKLQRGLV